MAVAHDDAWLPNEAKNAVCTQKHMAPDENCECGLWASDLESAYDHVTNEGAEVVGEVTLWGKIIEGENGFRAQNAYPTKLFVVSSINEEVRSALEAKYGVPVGRLEELVRGAQVSG